MPRLKKAKPATKPKAAQRRRPIPRALKLSLRTGTLALALLLLATTGLMAWTTGWIDRTAMALSEKGLQLTARAGFSVQEVLVVGRYSTDGTALLDALGVDRGDPILALDPHAARDAIIALPSVRTASVERRLPDTIVIQLAEREPLAIWQNGGRHRVIDTDGVVLAGYDPVDFAGLPLVVGTDAPGHAAPFLAVLASRPDIAGRTEAAVRVGDRRWDLALVNGVTVHLPTDGVARALDRLADLHELDRVFERDIEAIDLRLADRITVRASPVAAERVRLPEENT